VILELDFSLVAVAAYCCDSVAHSVALDIFYPATCNHKARSDAASRRWILNSFLHEQSEMNGADVL
jgi:hypothetical protein